MAKERIVYIDFMKGLCILLVVSFHIHSTALSKHVNDILQQFRIPMYFFLSGLFFKTYNGFGDFVRKKVNNIIIPMVFFLLIGTVYIFGRSMLMTHMNITAALHKMPLNPIDNNTPMWFLLVLFEVNIMYYLLQQYLPRLWTNIVAIGLSVIGYIVVYNGYNLVLYFDIALVALPYFILGSEAKQHGLLTRGPSLAVRLAMVVGVFVLLWFLASEINMKHRVYPDYLRLYLLPAVSIFALLFVCQYIKRPVPVISYIGRYSLIVLGTHYFLIGPLKILILKLLTAPFSFTHYLIVLVCVIAFELPIIHLLKKYLPRLTAQKEFLLEGWRLSWQHEDKTNY